MWTRNISARSNNNYLLVFLLMYIVIYLILSFLFFTVAFSPFRLKNACSLAKANFAILAESCNGNSWDC